MLAGRLREVAGEAAVDELVVAFTSRGGLDAPEAAATAMEREAGALFEMALTILYYAYYETPAVIAAIRSLGHVYNQAPQPEGYAMRPFDPEIDLPRARRGAFVATDAVTRVDLAAAGLRRGEAG
jgi:hypothetical protein